MCGAPIRDDTNTTDCVIQLEFRDDRRNYGWRCISQNRSSVLSGKSGKETPDDGRVELEEELQINHSALSVKDDNTSELIEKVQKISPHLSTVLQNRQQSGEINMSEAIQCLILSLK